MNKILLWLSILSTPLCWCSEAEKCEAREPQDTRADDPVFEITGSTAQRLNVLERVRRIWESQVEKLQQDLDLYRRNREGMANLVIAELVFTRKGVPAAGFTLRRTNQSEHTITRVELIAELTSEGRTVPWAKDKIVWDFPGGLMPGETDNAGFYPQGDGGKLSLWWKSAPQRSDYRLRVRLLAAYDESCDIFEDSDRGYEPLWFVDEDFSEEHVSERLKELRAKIARADRVIAELPDTLNKEKEDGKPAAR